MSSSSGNWEGQRPTWAQYAAGKARGNPEQAGGTPAQNSWLLQNSLAMQAMNSLLSNPAPQVVQMTHQMANRGEAFHYTEKTLEQMVKQGDIKYPALVDLVQQAGGNPAQRMYKFRTHQGQEHEALHCL